MDKQIKKPRVIVFDLETLYMELAGWGLYDQNFSVDHILEEWSICSFAAKVAGSKECLRIDTAGSRIDKSIVKKAIKFLQSADVLVSQNGIRFDLPKINSRAAIHNLEPNLLHRKMHVDLLQEGKRLFGHTSHKLAWISKMLTPSVQKSRHSKFEGIELWKEVAKKNLEAIKEMSEYNWQDVLATEAVYNEYIKWFDRVDLNRSIGPKSNPIYVPCRVCGGPTRSDGSVRRNTGLFKKYHCVECGVHTIPTHSGFNLDTPKKVKTTLTPSKAEMERLQTESKLLKRELEKAESRVEKLITKAKERKNGK